MQSRPTSLAALENRTARVHARSSSARRANSNAPTRQTAQDPPPLTPSRHTSGKSTGSAKSLLLFELDDNGSHVVTSQALVGRRVGGEALVEEVLENLSEILLVNALAHKVHSLLAGHHIPNAVAGQDHELILLLKFKLADVGVASNLLILGGTIVRLEGEVTNGTSHGQGAIDPLVLHKTAGLLNAGLFGVIHGLVVLGEGNRQAVTAQHRAGITSVGAIKLPANHQAGDGGRSTLSETSRVPIVHVSRLRSCDQEKRQQKPITKRRT
mmetsp:Transcript_67366/g.179856  ORF Transcript_67366/g.179856 Transcript_67366/m.179856 type:complete len:269 (+) Transcript_67366:461-1267(+)